MAGFCFKFAEAARMLPIPAPAAMSLPPNQAYSLEMGLVTRQICYAADLYALL